MLTNRTHELESGTLKRVVGSGVCAGCGGCAAIAPDVLLMQRSANGFLRPIQVGPLTSDQEEAVVSICPGVRVELDHEGRKVHDYWGPHVSARKGWVNEDALRFEASSGGALSGVLCHLLENDKVDAVVAVTADPDDPIANRTVICRTRDDILNSSGSRYAPSAPLEVVAPLLDDDRRFAFVGKPCDIAAMRAFSKVDPRVDTRFPIMISFFCAGVPSLKGGNAILKRMGVKKPDVVAFRYRGRGWPGYANAALQDGSSQRLSYADSWGEILSNYVQLRCRICPDGTGQFADIVFADAWATDARGFPTFDERDGVSLILSRTEIGERIVNDALMQGSIHADAFDLEDLAQIQPGQVSKCQLTIARLIALRCMGRATPSYRGFPLWRNAGRARVFDLLRNFFGTIRRGATGRLRT